MQIRLARYDHTGNTCNMAEEKIPSYPDVEKEAVNPSPIQDEEKEAVRRGSGAPEKVLKHANDADEAMKAFEGHEGEAMFIDEATNKRLLGRIDLNIMPVRISQE